MNMFSSPTPQAVSLNTEDREAILTASREFSDSWSTEFETGDEDEVYARIVAPWCEPNHSAFLLERQGSEIVLTDRLSETFSDCISLYPSILAAMHQVYSVASMRLVRPPSRS